jgi:hypothetical protein
MVTEGICLAVVKRLRGQAYTMTRTLNLDDTPGAVPNVSKSTNDNAMPPDLLIRHLLATYPLPDIESAIRWLEIGEYVGHIGWGMLMPRALLHLTPKGIAFADSGRLDAAERDLLYQENPYAAFVARQFAADDDELFAFLADRVLAPIGIKAFDGRVDGIEAFRGEILRKIRLARFFVCILTRRAQLRDGTFASSVWLYQETGAAVALGKKPLILVEAGLGEHYAGELQKNYEYITFARPSRARMMRWFGSRTRAQPGYAEAFQGAGQRILNDLDANHIPRPDPRTT